MSAGPRRFRVTCRATNSRVLREDGSYGFCTWRGGYRTADTAEKAGEKPCPRCKEPVSVHPVP